MTSSWAWQTVPAAAAAFARTSTKQGFRLVERSIEMGGGHSAIRLVMKGRQARRARVCPACFTSTAQHAYTLLYSWPGGSGSNSLKWRQQCDRLLGTFSFW
jgi:hypothetical protein